MKIAQLCEALGLNVQLHASRPAHRHCVAALRNTLSTARRPDMPNAMPPIYTCGYSDLLEDIGEDGRFPVPAGPGLAVSYGWERIEQSRTAPHVFE